MGKVIKALLVIILLMIIGTAIVGYYGEDKVQNAVMRVFMVFGGSGEGVYFTDSNYSTLGNDPNSYKGAGIELTAYLFNIVPENGHIISGNMEIEGYRGTIDQLTNNPMDTVNRLWITYNQTTLGYTPQLDSCILVKGIVRGQVEVTTVSGDTTYDTFIEATYINNIPCDSVPPN